MKHRITLGRNRQGLDPQAGFQSHREYLAAVMAAGLGEGVDNRLRLYAEAGSDEQFQGSNPLGGFLMPEAWAPVALTTDVDDPISGRTFPVEMQAPTVHIGARTDKDHTSSYSGGIRMLRHLETTQANTTRTTIASIRLHVNELLGVSHATNNLLSDSPRTFVALLDKSYRDETAGVLINERVRGTGVGEFMGVLNSPSLITVDKEAGQANDTVVAENFLNIRSRMFGYGNAVWIVSPDLYSQVLKARLNVGTAGAPLPIWHPGDEATGAPDRILGRPAFFHDAASAIGEAGDVICGNWGEYLDGTYVPLRADVSMHVRFIANEGTFRFYTRNDGKPWWLTPLTPRRASLTQSPFVTLQARAA